MAFIKFFFLNKHHIVYEQYFFNALKTICGAECENQEFDDKSDFEI